MSILRPGVLKQHKTNQTLLKITGCKKQRWLHACNKCACGRVLSYANVWTFMCHKTVSKGFSLLRTNTVILICTKHSWIHIVAPILPVSKTGCDTVSSRYCPHCSRLFRAPIGLRSHLRTHHAWSHAHLHSWRRRKKKQILNRQEYQ